MRFLCLDSNAHLEIYFAYDRIPTSKDHDEVSYKKNVYIKGGVNPENVRFVGITVVSKKIMLSQLGCAFNRLKKIRLVDFERLKNLKGELFKVKRKKTYADKVFEKFELMEKNKMKHKRSLRNNKGINYSKFIKFGQKFDAFARETENKSQSLDFPQSRQSLKKKRVNFRMPLVKISKQSKTRGKSQGRLRKTKSWGRKL